MTREFYTHKYAIDKGNKKTIEELNKIIIYLFSGESQNKKIEYLVTYLKNLVSRNEEILRTQ